jgi:hypothetical protein
MNYVFAILELLEESKADWENLIVEGIYFVGLIENGDEKFHDSDFLL